VFKKGEPNSIRLTTLARDFKALSKCKWAPKFDLNITFRTELAFLYYNAKAIPKLAHKMHSAWQLLQPWIVEAENRGAQVQLVFLTKAKTYQCMYGENNMMDTEEEWAYEFLETLGFDGATFRPAPIKNMGVAEMVFRGSRLPSLSVHAGYSVAAALGLAAAMLRDGVDAACRSSGARW
jgi:hypothetical protein